MTCNSLWISLIYPALSCPLLLAGRTIFLVCSPPQQAGRITVPFLQSLNKHSFQIPKRDSSFLSLSCFTTGANYKSQKKSWPAGSCPELGGRHSSSIRKQKPLVLDLLFATKIHAVLLSKPEAGISFVRRPRGFFALVCCFCFLTQSNQLRLFWVVSNRKFYGLKYKTKLFWTKFKLKRHN